MTGAGCTTVQMHPPKSTPLLNHIRLPDDNACQIMRACLNEPASPTHSMRVYVLMPECVWTFPICCSDGIEATRHARSDHIALKKKLYFLFFKPSRSLHRHAQNGPGEWTLCLHQGTLSYCVQSASTRRLCRTAYNQPPPGDSVVLRTISLNSQETMYCCIAHNQPYEPGKYVPCCIAYTQPVQPRKGYSVVQRTVSLINLDQDKWTPKALNRIV